jgi:hypothetical protein
MRTTAGQRDPFSIPENRAQAQSTFSQACVQTELGVLCELAASRVCQRAADFVAIVTARRLSTGR